MRVSFTTTLEKELVDKLKIEAINLNINANDILEALLADHFERQNEKQK